MFSQCHIFVLFCLNSMKLYSYFKKRDLEDVSSGVSTNIGT